MSLKEEQEQKIKYPMSIGTIMVGLARVVRGKANAIRFSR